MAPPKGVVYNPNGRPPKNRALTTILETAGAKKVRVGDKAISAKQLMARLLWEGVATGAVTFPSPSPDAPPSVMPLDGDQWLGLVKFIYQHVDGPPKQAVELSGPNGGPMEHVNLSDDERADRIAALLDRARARSTGQPT